MLVKLRYFDLEGTFVRYFYRDRYKFESFDLEKLVYLNGGGNCVVVPKDISIAILSIHLIRKTRL